MKKTLTTLAAVAALAVAGIAADASAKDWGKGSKVRIATEGAYAPWNFTDSSGKLVGFEVDLAADLCKRMEVECEVVQQAWEGIIPALEAGKYDVIMAGMSITEKRKKVISFSRSYAQTPAVFVVVKSSPSAGFKTELERANLDEVDAAEQGAIDALVKEFKGKTVGVQISTTHENFLREYLANDVTIKTYDTQEKPGPRPAGRPGRRGPGLGVLLGAAAELRQGQGHAHGRSEADRRAVRRRCRRRHPAGRQGPGRDVQQGDRRGHRRRFAVQARRAVVRLRRLGEVS